MAKTIIITGAGSGIGAATAVQFLEAGWNVGLIGRRRETLDAVAGGEPQALVLPCDVTVEAQVQDAVDAAVARFGRLDTLFNNAGIFTPGAAIDEIPLADWQASIDVNLTGSFICAKAAFGAMRAQDPQGGRIINNGSISAHVPRANSTPYTASKHAMTGLTKSISLDGRAYNIACGQIDVGNARTDMVAALGERAKAAGEEPEATMDVDHVAKAVLQMAELPLESNVQFMTIMATRMAYIGRG